MNSDRILPIQNSLKTIHTIILDTYFSQMKIEKLIYFLKSNINILFNKYLFGYICKLCKTLLNLLCVV